MFQDRGQLELFKEHLPWHGFGSDRKGSAHMYTADVLIQKALVQANPKHDIFWVIYDLDHEQSMLEWQDRNCPPPNIIAINPDNGHAHLYYGLEKPVHNNYESSQKALRYLASIDLALTEKLGADPGYSRLLSKNPTHPNWLVFFPRAELYDLDELATWLDLSRFKDKRKRLPKTGYGRNCTLFENLRTWAYSERRKPQEYFNQDMFYEAVLSRGLAMNTDYTPPLPHSEVRATARSISKWTWRNIDPDNFKAWQKQKSEHGNRVKTQKALKLRTAIFQTLQEVPELTQKELAFMFGVARETVNRHVKELRKGQRIDSPSDLGNVTPPQDTHTQHNGRGNVYS